MTKRKIPKKIYDKVESMAWSLKDELKRKGYAIPVQNSNGSIDIENYTIIKKDGFYQIIENNQIIVDKINLPQTAALLANDLALNKKINYEVLNTDRDYGFRLFDQEHSKYTANKLIKKQEFDRAELLMNKCSQAQIKSNLLKKEILIRFAKLRRLR